MLDKRSSVPSLSSGIATEKVRLPENTWNTRDRHRVSLVYTLAGEWSHHSHFTNAYRDSAGNRFRACGHEDWAFGFMQTYHPSINNLPISQKDRRFRWAQGRRPDEHTGLAALGL